MVSLQSMLLLLLNWLHFCSAEKVYPRVVLSIHMLLLYATYCVISAESSAMGLEVGLLASAGRGFTSTTCMNVRC